MKTNNFSRSNVNESTLQITSPNRSSFDLSRRIYSSFRMGRFLPIAATPMMPTDTFKGSLHPQLQLEKFAGPAAGRMRMDTHTFFVSYRRIMNDYRQFIQSAMDGNNPISLPSFSLRQLVESLLKCAVNQLSESTPDYTLAGLVALSSGEIASFKDLDLAILSVIRSYYVAMSSEELGDDATYWNKDFLAEEMNRFNVIESQINAKTYPTNAQELTVYNMPVFGVLIDILKPYFGEGSILDMFGYDILTVESPDAIAMRNIMVEWYESPDTAADYDYWLNFALGNFVGINTFLADEEDAPSITLYPARLQNELFVRASYAAWFDYIRNYHLEKTSEVLNPDEFDRISLFNFDDFDYEEFFTMVELLIPRWRYFGRDGFTTVQPDDVYRHVAVPVDSTEEFSSQSLVVGYSGEGITGVDYDSIFSIGGQDIPRSLFGFGDTASAVMLRNDLMTMRRAGMLEKYLARNFYNPDTYSGYIQAHYGVKPLDFAVLCSEYLGGDESSIDGQQTINSTSTEQAPAGTRTLVADAEHSDSFSYNTTEPGILISFLSLMPLPTYDARNMHLEELKPIDMPLPEFANDTRVQVRTCDMIRNYNDHQDTYLGYVPRYIQYRQELDSAHGKYLRDYRGFTWLRDRYMDSQGSYVSLNAYAARCHMSMTPFLTAQTWDDIAYGQIDYKLFVDRPLPAAIEVI